MHKGTTKCTDETISSHLLAKRCNPTCVLGYVSPGLLEICIVTDCYLHYADICVSLTKSQRFDARSAAFSHGGTEVAIGMKGGRFVVSVDRK